LISFSRGSCPPLSPEAHAEWGLYKILEHMGFYEILPSGAGQNRAELRKDIEEYHMAYDIDFDETNIDTFIAWRPDGLAFDKEKKAMFVSRIYQSNGPQ